MSSIHTFHDGILGKICSGCLLWFPLLGFHRDRTNADGFSCRCKTCKSAYKRSTAGRASSRRYNLTDSARASHKRYRRSKKGIATKKAREAARRGRFPDKQKARETVSYAIVSNKMPPASTCKCAKCSNQANDYHHQSYDQERWLDVTPLCRPCHRKTHRLYP